MTRDPALERLLAFRGNARRIAEACDISRAAVYAWERVPAERVPIIAAALGVEPFQIRPDLWQPTQAQASD